MKNYCTDVATPPPPMFRNPFTMPPSKPRPTGKTGS